jgi:hypothetical protein
MAAADGLGKSVWRRSGGKGSLGRESSCLNSVPAKAQIEEEMASKSQVIRNFGKERDLHGDLVVPEISRGIYIEGSAEKDQEAAQTHFTDNNSSLFNSSLKSSLGQKSLLQELEEQEASDEGIDHSNLGFSSKILVSVPQLPFRKSPKVTNPLEIHPLNKNEVTEFEENSPSRTDSDGQRSVKRELFKPQSQRAKGVWALREDSSVTLQVGSPHY